MFESSFAEDRRSPMIVNDLADYSSLQGDYKRFRGYDLYAGHYGRDVVLAVNEGHACITNFRDPAARLVSLYNFFRFKVALSDDQLRMDRYYAVRLAKLETFSGFVSNPDPRVQVYTCNAHFRQLAYSCWSLELANSFGDVVRFIDRMPWYYVCEYADLSLRWLHRVFSLKLDEIPQENVTGDYGGLALKLSAIHNETYEVIRQNNHFDFAIYRYAVHQFLERAAH
jgi:hypothetical protein